MLRADIKSAVNLVAGATNVFVVARALNKLAMEWLVVRELCRHFEGISRLNI